jgi:hypothetical protein
MTHWIFKKSSCKMLENRPGDGCGEGKKWLLSPLELDLWHFIKLE